MTSAYRKDIFRTLRDGWRRFIAIAVITALGVTMFSGLQASCEDLCQEADSFYDSQNLEDIKIQSTLGLTDEDVEALLSLADVETASGIYSGDLTVYTEDGGSLDISFQTIASDGTDAPYVVEGTMPSEADQCAVTQEMAENYGLSVGDTLTVSSGNEDETVTEDTFVISALIIDPTSVGSTSGAVSYRNSSVEKDKLYILPEAVDSDVYTAILVRMRDSDSYYTYDNEYSAAVSELESQIRSDVQDEREEARWQQVKDQAYETLEEEIAPAESELEEGRQELSDAEAEAEQQFADAQSQIDSGLETLQSQEDELNAQAQELEESAASLAESKADVLAQEESLTSQKSDLQAQLDSLTAQKEDLQAQLDSLTAQKEDLQAQLDSLTAQKEDLQAQLDSLNSQKEELQAQQESLNSQKTELQAQQESLSSKKTDLQAQLESLSSQKTDLQTQLESLNSQKEAIQARTDISDDEKAKMISEIESSISLVTDNINKIDDSLSQITAGISETETYLSKIQAGISEIDDSLPQIAEAIAQIDAAVPQLTEGIAQIDEATPQLTEGISQLDSGISQLTDGISQLDSGIEQIESGIAQIDDGLSQLETARAQIEDGEAQIESGRAQIEDGRAQIQQAKDELAAAQAELDDSKASAEETFAGKEQELADGEQELADEKADAIADIEAIERPTWYIQNRNSLSSYGNVKSDSDSIESIGTVFPILFLAVAILISLTAITRMVEEERGLLGTYRALGFRDSEIRRKYLIFAALSALAGSAVGTLGAFVILPSFLFWVFTNMYLFPEYHYSFLPGLGTLGPAVFIAAVLIAAWAVCKKELSETPAELMRPKAPPAGKRIFLEYIPFIWNRLSFLSKVTARNLFRYMKRFLMTVVGIAGCIALLLFGFAVQDSVTDMLPKQYGGIFQYDGLAVASSANDTLLSYIDEAESNGEIDKKLNLYVTSVTIKNTSGDQISAQLYVIPEDADLDGLVSLKDTNGNEITLSDGQTWVTVNAVQILNLSEGGTFEVQTADMPDAEVTLDGVAQNYLGNYIYMTQNTFEQYFGEYSPNAEIFTLTDEVTDQTAWCTEFAEKEDITTCASSEEVKSEFNKSFELVNTVVYVVIIMSAALAFTVLYTLETTNISERERELATIKVLGFFDREVSLYVNKEVFILTLIGIVAGIPLGRAFAQTLNTVLRFPAIYLEVSLHPSSYLISAVLVFVFAILVQLVTEKILKRIDPVTALKSAE
ncbi:MAG: FtsX-like permease family protein [Lachnospiraceae bacterium]|jgi:putative ABC transport system permease protein